tara:strand:- start:223 stop:1161 length:939 start_codon:yes stop_codon:yes gene_type:complete
MPTVKGVNLVEQNPSIAWDKNNGFSFTKEFEGETTAVRGLMGRYVRDGSASNIRFEPDGATAKLFVNYQKDVWGGSGLDETPVEIWELDGNDTQYSLWEHPKIKALDFTSQTTITAPFVDAGETFNANEVNRNRIKKQLEQDIETDDDGKVTEPAFLSATSTTDRQNPACSADLKNIYRHLTKEQDSWQRPTYTLRHTLTFSPEYNYAANVVQRAYSYVNYIITPAQLTGNATIGEPTLDAAITTSITNAQTNSLPANVNASTGQQTIDGITHQWGWLKSAPKIVSEGRRKITLTQEWKLELWSTWIYTVAS